VDFVAPDSTYPTNLQRTSINLFLYEVKENRELRSPLPTIQPLNGRTARRRAPLRVDCSYMVTTWSKAAVEPDRDGHNLLGQTLNWLSRFPTIPERFFPQPNLPIDPGMPHQPFAPPTMVAQMDGAKSAGEFWHALGIPPRPYFNLIVTISMALDQSVDDSIVTTVTSRYTPSTPASAEELMMIGGTVRDGSGNPVADAWVRLESVNPLALSQTQATDAQGRFIFDRVAKGTGYTLRARAQGHAESQVPNLEVPSLSGKYDLVV